jgi:hypothetical protein
VLEQRDGAVELADSVLSVRAEGSPQLGLAIDERPEFLWNDEAGEKATVPVEQILVRLARH